MGIKYFRGPKGEYRFTVFIFSSILIMTITLPIIISISVVRTNRWTVERCEISSIGFIEDDGLNSINQYQLYFNKSGIDMTINCNISTVRTFDELVITHNAIRNITGDNPNMNCFSHANRDELVCDLALPKIFSDKNTKNEGPIEGRIVILFLFMSSISCVFLVICFLCMLVICVD